MRDGDEPRRSVMGWLDGPVAVLISVLISVLALAVAGIDAWWNQGATRTELRLGRQQVIASLRPILTPVVGPDSPSITFLQSRGETLVRIPLRNISNAPTLGGTIVVTAVAPPGTTFVPTDVPPFPTCAGVVGKPYADTVSFASVPPVAPLQTVTVEVTLFFDFSTIGPGAYCAAAVYADASANQWVTDWAWEELKSGEKPPSIRSFQVRETEADPDIPGLYYEPTDESG